MKSEIVEEIELPLEDIFDVGEHVKLKINKAAKEAFDNYIEEEEVNKSQYEFNYTVTVNVNIIKKI